MSVLCIGLYHVWYVFPRFENIEVCYALTHIRRGVFHPRFSLAVCPCSSSATAPHSRRHCPRSNPVNQVHFPLRRQIEKRSSRSTSLLAGCVCLSSLVINRCKCQSHLPKLTAVMLSVRTVSRIAVLDGAGLRSIGHKCGAHAQRGFRSPLIYTESDLGLRKRSFHARRGLQLVLLARAVSPGFALQAG